MVNRRHIRVVGAMLEREPGRYLITQRPPAATLPLLWEFPGGRVEACDASDEAALVRELRERLGVEVEVLEQAAQTHHTYERYDLDFSVFRCRLKDPGAEPRPLRANACRWVSLGELADFQFPDADARTVAALLGDDADADDAGGEGGAR